MTLSSKRTLTGLSFFSGAMGLDLGMEAAGIKTLCVAEFDKACRSTIAANRPDLPLLNDVSKLTAAEVRAAANLTNKQKVDVVFGGPPCQAFSTAGKQRGFDDARGNVFLDFLKLAADLDPTYIVIENVRGLLYAAAKGQEDFGASLGLAADQVGESGGALRLICAYLQSRGYGVSFNLYNSANFGVPQARERVVILAKKGGAVLPYLVPSHSNDKKWGLPGWVPLQKALDGLSPARSDEYLPLRPKIAKYLALLSEGQYWKDLPEAVQEEAMGKAYHLQGGKTGFYRRLAWEKPSPTLVTSPAMPATLLGHPDELRPLSVPEYKRVQQFPDSWVLSGKLAAQYKQLGNAVPVGLGRAIGEALMRDALDRKDLPPANFSFSRYNNTSSEDWGI